MARVSLRQLQWWDEKHVVSPRHQGHRRMYNPTEVLEVTVIAELRRKGFSLQKLRRVLRYLQRDMGRRLSDVLAGDSSMHLLTDGKSIYLEDQPGAGHRHPQERPPAHVPGMRQRPRAPARLAAAGNRSARRGQPAAAAEPRASLMTAPPEL